MPPTPTPAVGQMNYSLLLGAKAGSPRHHASPVALPTPRLLLHPIAGVIVPMRLNTSNSI
ncbi:hypothetical protein LEMLEM_LOCUS26768 [Lemmus lemmus]